MVADEGPQSTKKVLDTVTSVQQQTRAPQEHGEKYTGFENERRQRRNKLAANYSHAKG